MALPTNIEIENLKEKQKQEVNKNLNEAHLKKLAEEIEALDEDEQRVILKKIKPMLIYEQLGTVLKNQIKFIDKVVSTVDGRVIQ